MTFKKDDAQKPRYDLIPPHAELELAHVLTMGAEKYGPNNWHQGGPESNPRYIAAAQRHIAAYRRGETHDPESGRHHLAHAVASLMFVLEFEAEDAGWIGDAVEGVTEDVTEDVVFRYGFKTPLNGPCELWVKESVFGGFSSHMRGRNFGIRGSGSTALQALHQMKNHTLDTPCGQERLDALEDAIAAYKRENQEVDRTLKVFSRSDGKFRIDVFKVKSGEFKAELYRHEEIEDERIGSNALTCMEWIRSTAHHQGKNDALMFMTSACESFRMGQ